MDDSGSDTESFAQNSEDVEMEGYGYGEEFGGSDEEVGKAEVDGETDISVSS